LPNVAGTQGGVAAAAAAADPPSAPAASAGHKIEARMSDMSRGHDRRLTRRTLLKGGLAVGALAVGAGVIKAGADADSSTTAPAVPAQRRRPGPYAQTQPNILVLIVDQLRYPQWFSPEAIGGGLPPNIQRLHSEGVSFARHYTVSNDCTPSRSAMLTGLYTHQTGCLITGGSTLDPAFPTWGTLLRERGYDTRWYGKWHLTHHDNWWRGAAGERALAPYGFAGGTFPSPDGAPGQGWRVDPHIASQFEDWFAAEGQGGPWCTTVSFVNPHDIAWWYVWSDRVAAEATAAPLADQLPPNFETPEQLALRGKPRLQRSLQATAATSFGAVPFEGLGAEPRWLEFMNLYAKLQLEVDAHVGRVLDALAKQPAVAANTVVVFTSDHGEYLSSHGLRGKGAGAYEEAIRVPLIVKDPRGVLTAAPTVERTQLSSSVDLAPMLLTIGSGSDDWRREAHYAHLAGRPDLVRILADPGAPGRAHVLHATDEVVTEFAIEPYAAQAPLHVTAIRTQAAKYATYSHWRDGSIEPLAEGRESELYDYGTHGGRLELENGAGTNPIESQLNVQLQEAIADELREPLPPHLRRAHSRGFADYFTTAKRAAEAAVARRRRRAEGLLKTLHAGESAPGGAGESLKPGDAGESLRP
jgi:arylsulfatase A-like enzyme